MAQDFNRLNVWLPKKLQEAGLSGVEQLANRAGLSRTAIYRWLYDDDRPTEDSLLKVCHVLGADFAEALQQYTPRKVGRPRERDDKKERKKKSR